jgi:hypothetical protein
MSNAIIDANITFSLRYAFDLPAILYYKTGRQSSALYRSGFPTSPERRAIFVGAEHFGALGSVYGTQTLSDHLRQIWRDALCQHA